MMRFRWPQPGGADDVPNGLAAAGPCNLAPMADSSTAAAASPEAPRLPPARPLWRRFLAFLVPMMLANILQSLSGTINNIYVGQMIGVEALAAVVVFFPIVILFISFVIGLALRRLGADRPGLGRAASRHKVKAIAGTTLALGLLLGLVVALFGGTFTEALLRVLGTPADILPRRRHAMPASCSSACRASSSSCSSPRCCAASAIRSRRCYVADALHVAVGLVVTPALIRGWFGLPQLGVASGACAAVIVVAWCAWLFCLASCAAAHHALAPDAGAAARICASTAPCCATVLRIGIPTAVQMVIILDRRDRRAVRWSTASARMPRRPTARSTRCSATCSSRRCRSPSRPRSSARRRSAPGAPNGWGPSPAPG